MTIAVVGTLTTTQDKAEEVRKILQDLAKVSQDDKGCNKYEFYEDFKCPGTPGPRPDPRPGVFSLIEEWKDPESLDAHNKSEHFQKASK